LRRTPSDMPGRAASGRHHETAASATVMVEMPAPPVRSLDLAAMALSYMADAKARNTCRAYRSDWSHFARWCTQHGFTSLPTSPETVTLYLDAQAGIHRPSTLQRKLPSISKAHRLAGYESPATLRHGPVSEMLKGIRRRHGTAQQHK